MTVNASINGMYLDYSNQNVLEQLQLQNTQ